MPERRIFLSGEKVLLGEMLPEDQPMFHAWHAENRELLQLIDDPHAPTLAEQQRWFARSKEPDRMMFSLLTAESNILIGHGGLVDIDQKKKSAQFRITIGDPAYWGKGFGTEATELIARYAQGRGIGQLWLRVLKTNARAVRSYEKSGFHIVAEEGRVGKAGGETVKMELNEG